MAFYQEFDGRTLFARHENRLFYPVVFCDGPKVTPAGDLYCTVYFSDGWYKNVASCEIIGPHFSSIDAGTRLYLGQRVFAYYMGKEHRGSVIDQVGDVVRVRLDQFTELMCFNLTQLRLSADIARPHFGSLDSFEDFTKHRPAMLDVKPSERRSQAVSPDCSKEGPSEDTQDIRNAALALTSLSLASPVAGQNEGAQKEQFTFPTKAEKDEEMEPPLASQVDEGYSDSVLKPRTRSFETPKNVTLRKTRTGSLDLNIVEPARERKFERAESWDVEKYSPESKAQKLEKMNKVFKCMWRGCGKVLISLPGIVRHVKTAHLGPQTEDNVEFYFNDLFIENDTSFSSEDSLLSSGISDDETLIENEDCQEEGLQMAKGNDDNATKAEPQEEGTTVEEEKESQSNKQERNTRSRIPKSKGRIRASRERTGYGGIETARKCRKVYGMDNRNLWCTQCRWKKACVRFGK